MIPEYSSYNSEPRAEAGGSFLQFREPEHLPQNPIPQPCLCSLSQVPQCSSGPRHQSTLPASSRAGFSSVRGNSHRLVASHLLPAPGREQALKKYLWMKKHTHERGRLNPQTSKSWEVHKQGCCASPFRPDSVHVLSRGLQPPPCAGTGSEAGALALWHSGLKGAELIPETSSLTTDLDFFPQDSGADGGGAALEFTHLTLDLKLQ